MLSVRHGVLRIILIHLLICIGVLHISSQRHDHIWLFGYGNDPEQGFGGLVMDFNQAIPTFGAFEVPTFLGQRAILSDIEGDLLAYTEGCRVYNRVHETMAGGDSINFGERWLGSCDGLSYPESQGVLLLPDPSGNALVYLLHLRRNDDFETMDVLFSVIDFTAQGGLGQVVLKNQELGSFADGDYITAIRHGNGRDWWIVVPVTGSDNYFIALLSPNGFTDVSTQAIGSTQSNMYWSGQVSTSPNGNWFAFHNPNKGLDLLGFDRCEGRFESFLELGTMADSIKIGAGVAFSASSRFLYASNLVSLYQFDLEASDILGSKTLVGQYDGFMNPLPATFFQATLAPNRKIYLSASNTVKSLHVIHEPDLKGDLCEFEQHGVELPVHNGWEMPNFPHFNLGADIDSQCDTLAPLGLPVADFKWIVDSLDGYYVCFQNASFGHPEMFVWSFGDNETSESVNPSYRFSSPGVYNVCLTAINGNGSHTHCAVLDLDSATSSPPDTDFLKVYPNPFADHLILEMGRMCEAEVLVKFSDIAGRLIFSRRYATDDEQLHVNLPSIPAGVYIYEVVVQGFDCTIGTVVKVSH